MERSLLERSLLLYQQAEEAADDLRAQRRAGKERPVVPPEFAKAFFSFIDALTLGLMDDKDNFFGYFLFQMDKEIRFDITDAASTAFKGTRYVLYLNPLQFLPLSGEQMETSIKHQILHIVSLHLIRAGELRRSYSKLAVNLAMDVVVNTYLDHLPPFATTLTWVNINYNLRLRPYETFEYYVEEIQKALDARTEKKDDIEEDSRRDELIALSYDPERTHASWDESDRVDEQTWKKFTTQYVDAANKGQLSNYLESMISSMKAEAGSLPWHWYLKKLVGSIASGKKRTTARRNRRQPERLDLPGHLRAHKARLCVAVDISGSISDAEFKQAMQEVFHIVRYCKHEITLVECDDEIRRIYEIHSLQDIKNRLDVRGGTSFAPVFEYANGRHFDVVLYFTDGKGESSLRVRPKGYKVLWVLSGYGESLSLAEPFGLVKRLKPIKKEYDPTLDFDNVEKGGFSMNNQEGIAW